MLNILSYSVYLPIAMYITVAVGKAFHRNGYYYIKDLYDDEKITVAVNNILLIGYYTVNLGYAVLWIAYWPITTTVNHVIENLTHLLGLLCMGLAILHYMNIIIIAMIAMIRKRNNNYPFKSNTIAWKQQ